MASGWQALRRGESASERRRQLERAHEQFVGSAAIAADREARERFAEQVALRPVVLESWLRSQRRTIDPDRPPDRPALSEDQLAELRRVHPIGRVLPVIERLLLDAAEDAGFIVAVGDAAGRLLWVDGDFRLRSRAEDMGFRAGMDWSEGSVGTSAPGSALALDHAIQVLGAEHYNRAVHQWSCTAAPVHNPETGAIIGVIDVTGGDSAASRHILPLVEATLGAVEAELKLESLRDLIEERRSAGARPAPRSSSTTRLVVLGRDPAILEHGDASLPLTGRHAEILLALAAAPQGLTAAALAEEVYGTAGSEQTLRAELVRLRKWCEQAGIDLGLSSRPYRMAQRIRIDGIEMLEALERGAHRLALAAYEGPVLPASTAPVAERLRSEVDATLREAMLQSAGADPLFEYAQHWAGDDAEVWETLLQVLPPLSPKRARVVARLEALDDGG
ncbi:sigma-54-dependent transcriptional regulator family protein [Leucobacter tenebrionis]|uniref:transcriptional regulator n=1 Tax=Leucobacter tenebrionis TaxID=2873270 RepID=UPI001CA6C1E5|nr:transcriptional regulator [Leucobacter tenebrionis]QZY51845.1 transcriptional regulator [Leucobacter tenebrionis]